MRRTILLPTLVWMAGCGSMRIDQTMIRPGHYYVDVQGSDSDDRVVLMRAFHERAKRICGTLGYDANPQAASEPSLVFPDGARTYNVTGHVQCRMRNRSPEEPQRDPADYTTTEE